MKFTIDRRLFIRMLEQARRGSRHSPNRDPESRITACCARVFVGGQVVTVGHEALVLEDGECRVPTAKFLRVLRSFEGRENLTVATRQGELAIERFTMSVTGCNGKPSPPASFQVFPVRDLQVVRHSPRRDREQP